MTQTPPAPAPAPIKVPRDSPKVIAARKAMFRDLAQTKLRVGTTLERLFLATDFSNDVAVEALLRRVVGVVQASQMTVANRQIAFQNVLASERGYETTASEAIRKKVLATRLGKAGKPLDQLEVYRRPVTAIYTELSKGKSFPQAQKAGVLRLAQIFSYDLQASSNIAATLVSPVEIGRDGLPKIIRYRRTLSGSENCPICEIASTQRYWTGDLRPIHGSCDCGVEALPPGFPSGQVIDPTKLAALKTAHRDFVVTQGNMIRDPKTGEERVPTFKDLTFAEDSEKGFVLTWANRSHKTL